jgi:hypothetical protein
MTAPNPVEAAVNAAASAIADAIRAQADAVAAWNSRESTAAVLDSRTRAIRRLVDQLERLRAEPQVVEVLRFNSAPADEED